MKQHVWADMFQQNVFNNMTFKNCSPKKPLSNEKKKPHPFSTFGHVTVATTALSFSGLSGSHSAT